MKNSLRINRAPMAKKNFTYSSWHDVTSTLSMTVGSPSAHRRGTMLKHVAFLLLFLFSFGVGNVWAEEVTSTYTFSSKSWASSVNTGGTACTWTGTMDGNQYSATQTPAGVQVTAAKSGVEVTSSASFSNVSSVEVKYNSSSKGVGSIAIQVGSTSITAQSIAKSQSNKVLTFSPASGTLNGTIKLTCTCSTNSFAIVSIAVTTTSGSQQTTPLATPTGMSSGTPGMTSATLSWNTVTNADGYALTIGNNTPITTGFTIANGKVSYTLNNLTADTEYTWKVKATTTHTDTYSNSADCAAQNFTTADDPSFLSLTFGLTSNPGGWPTDNSTTTTNYTYTLSSTAYTFALNNVKCNSGYLMMTKTAILGLPAISNYKLVKVVASNSGGCSTSVNVGVSSSSSSESYITGGAKQTWSTQSSAYTYNLSGTDYNTMYYLYVTSANAQVTQLRLKYAPKPSVSSISIKTAPSKTTYTANETFNPSGLVITVNYSDNTSEDIAYNNTTASDFSFSPTTSTALNATHTAVTVTYGGKTANQAITVNRIATTLAWSAASYTANIGVSYSFPTLTKTPNNLSGMTYSSSNTGVATINANTGVISVVGTGSTTITAAFAQTNVYAAATSATYTLTINAASSPSLEADPTSLAFPLTAVGGSSELTFDLYGEHLTANASIAISGANANMFSVIASVDKDASDEIAETITVTYAPTAAAVSHSATLTITSGVASATVTLSGSAKNRRTVTWYKADDTELTAQERGSATTEVWDGDAVTVLPSAPSSCDQAISFQGWTDEPYAKSDDAPAVLFSDAEDAPEISGGNASYYAVWANASGSAGSVEINTSVEGYPTNYTTANTFDDLTVSEIDFKIQQICKNNSDNSVMQWRALANQNGTGTIYNNEAFPGHISSVVVVFTNSDANKNHTLKIGDSANPTSGTAITPTSNGNTYTFDCSAYNFDYFVLANGSNAGYTSSVTINYAASIKDYATTCSVPVEIADPTFSPAAGSYNDDQNVTITAEDGMTIYYSIGAESNPKTSGTQYSGAISVTEDKVIKAVATDGKGNWSNVVTKTYTINYSSSIAAYIAKAQATTRYLRLNAARNCVVTAVKKNNQDKVTNIYCQDNSGAGIIIYNGSGFGDNEINVGDRIVGAVSGTWSPYLMQPEMGSAVFADGVTFTAVSRPDAPTVTVANVNSGDAYTAHPMMLVTVADLYYKSVNGSAYTFNTQANGEGTDITIYDNFSYLSGKTMPGVACTIVGIMARNNNAYQVLPVELTTAATADLPTISPEGGADAEHAVEVTYLTEITIGSVENEDITIKLNDVEKTDANPILVQGDLKLEISAKRDFCADNSVTYYYKPSAYPKDITTVSAHGTMTVKVGDNVVETALPTSTVNVTISNVESHFTLTGVAVKDADNGDVEVTVNAGVYSFEMPNKNVTITANYLEDTKYSITFNGGGAEGEGPAAFEDQYAGTEITLPTKEEANYTAPTDKVFNGWVVTSGEDEVEQNNGKFDMPAGNVTIEAQWADRVYCALTLNINGATTTTNIDREVKYILPTEEDPISGYDFYGWTEAPEVDDVEDAIDTIKSFTPAADEASKTLYAVFKRTETGANKTDVITAADLAATSTGYVEFSNVQKNSSAKYAGKTAKNGTNIQINDASGQCIISTTSGGLVKNVSITWGSSSNTLDVYASNTAYTAIGDLWDNSKKGTKVTSFTATGSYNFTNDYSYVGIRSSKNAIQLASVSITWQPSTTYYTTAPAVVYDVEYNLGSNPAGAWKANEGCAATKVKGGQTYIICADEPVREHHKFNGWTVGGSAVSGTITINANTEIVADWIAKAQSNVTYDAGTGSGSDVVVANVEEGTEVTLKAIGSGEGQANFTKTGYNFKGWLSNGVLYKAGETFEMPAEAVTLTAQWKKQNITKMTLVTDVAQLVDGSKVVIVSKDPVSNSQTRPSAIAGPMSGNNKFLASVTEDLTFNGDNTISYNAETAIELTLDKVDGGWALRSGDNYLAHVSGQNQVKWQSDTAVWSISFSGNNATIKFGDNYFIQYNASSNSERFSAYSGSQNAVQLYASLTAITENASISEIGYVEGDVIVVSGENTTLTMDAPSAPTSITVKDGATVTVSAQTTADNITVEEGGTVEISAATTAATVTVKKGAKMEIEENGSVTTNEPLVLYTTLGKGTGTTANDNAPGSSSEIINAERLNATGDVYLEIELTQDAKASYGWYAFSVPFQVDAMNGVYFGETKLTNEVGYAIMKYHGDLRANGEYGWKKYRDIMQPGELYIITVADTEYKTLRFKKVADAPLAASDQVAVKKYALQEGGSTGDNGWNGLGNPNLQVSYYGSGYMHFLEHGDNAFKQRTGSNINLVVGSAFFIQYGGSDGNITITKGTQGGANGYLAPAREPKAIENVIHEVKIFKGDKEEDNVFFTAREDATNTYETGKDVAKLSMGTAKCAQMMIPAYGTNLCAADFPLVNDKASYPLTITTPAAGDYRIELAEAYEDATIYLTYEGRVIWNLSMSPYEVELQQGQTEGYGLRLVAAPQTPTDIENTDALNGANGVQKVIIDEHVYILRGEQLFDVTGKAAR